MSQGTAQKAAELDNLYVKLVKYAVVGLMTLALLSIIILLPLAGYNYFQSPVPPAPAKEPPERTINVEDLKKFLIEEEKRRQEQEKSGNAPVSRQPVNAPAVTLLYAEQVIALYRCSEEFRKLAEQESDNATEAERSQRNEAQRANIERLAADPFRGSNWVGAMVNFTCSVLKNVEIAKLKKEKAVGAVVNPAINFHARAWAAIEKDKSDFRQGEKLRVEQEVASEAARVAVAKAKAMFLLGLAGGAIVFFLAMALYLIFAKIEANLALIHQAIVQRTLPAATSA